jgi:hypothetical protein
VLCAAHVPPEHSDARNISFGFELHVQHCAAQSVCFWHDAPGAPVPNKGLFVTGSTAGDVGLQLLSACTASPSVFAHPTMATLATQAAKRSRISVFMMITSLGKVPLRHAHGHSFHLKRSQVSA